MTSPLTNVLIIDDSDMIRSMLRVSLQSDGHTVMAEAATGVAGLEMAKIHQPDIIFLDIVLPDRNGIEMITEIKNVAPNAIVLMITSKKDGDSVRHSLEAGAKGYIIKPFTMSTVSKTLNTAIARAMEMR
jgi:two-component system chemotaxis response regulator CheY